MTMRLIQEAGFSGVCIEGDWPNTYALHSYVTVADPAQTLDGAFEPLKSVRARLMASVRVVY